MGSSLQSRDQFNPKNAYVKKADVGEGEPSIHDIEEKRRDDQLIQAAAASAVSGSAGQPAIAAAAATQTPERPPHPSSLKLSRILDPLFPHLDSNGLACLLRIGIAVRRRTQKELDKRSQRDAKIVKIVMNLTLRGRVSDLHLLMSPTHNTPYQVSDECHLYLYQEKDGRVFYCYTGSQEQQKHYLHDEKQKQPPIDFKSHSFDTTLGEPHCCVDEALRKSVFDITSKREHTRCSDSEEIRRMVDENGALPFVVYRPQKEEDKTARNQGGQLISLVDKMPLQLAHGEDHDPAKRAMTAKLLAVPHQKQREENARKIQAAYDAQNAPGSAAEERVKAENKENVSNAQKALTKAVLESIPGDIQNAGFPTYKLTLAETEGGAAIAAAVTQLEASLKTVRNTVVRTGCHDNPELQLQAREEYDRLIDAGHNWWLDDKMQFLFCNLGRYQQMMSLGYAHGFCGDGLYKNVGKLQKGQTPRESKGVRMWDSVRRVWDHSVGLYSLGGRLGVDFAVVDAGSLEKYDGVFSRPHVGRLFSNLMSIKNSRHTDPLRSSSETIGHAMTAKSNAAAGVALTSSSDSPSPLRSQSVFNRDLSVIRQQGHDRIKTSATSSKTA